MTAPATPIDGTLSVAFKLNEEPAIKIFTNGKKFFVPFEAYEAIWQNQVKETKSQIEHYHQIKETMEGQSNDFSDTLASVNRKWSRRVALSDRERLAVAIVISVLTLLVIALATALTISLAILL